MIKLRKRWVLLGVVCVILTLWAWDMVDDFRDFAGQFRGGRDFVTRDETLGRPLRVLHIGVAPQVSDAWRAIGLRSGAMVLSGAGALQDADGLVVAVSSWRAAPREVPAPLAGLVLPNLATVTPADRTHYFQFQAKDGSFLPVMVVNQAGFADWPTVCRAVLIHDSMRLWTGEAAFFDQMAQSRTAACIAENWTTVPAGAPKF